MLVHTFPTLVILSGSEGSVHIAQPISVAVYRCFASLNMTGK